MAKEVYDWSATDASNNFSPSDGGWPENMDRALVNNAARADLGALRRFYNDPEFLNLFAEPLRVVSKVTDTSFRVAGVDATSDFPVDRRVRVTDGTTTVSGFVTNAVFAAGDTTVTVVLDSGVVPAATNKVLVHSGKTIKKLAFRNTLPMDSVFDVKEDFGAVGNGIANDQPKIQNAIDAAEAAGGGIVFFPPGFYLCNAGLTIEVSKVSLLGSGMATSVLVNGSATANLLTIGVGGSDTQQFFVKSLGFTTQTGVIATAGACIFLRRVSRGVVFEDLMLGGSNQFAGYNPPFRAIYTDGSVGRFFNLLFKNIHISQMVSGGIYFNNGSDSMIESCQIGDCGADGGLVLDTAVFMFVSHCDILLNVDAGLRIRQTFAPISPSNGSHDIFIESVECESNLGYNFWISRGGLICLSNCIGLAPNGAVATQDNFFFDSSGTPLSDVVDVVVSNCVAYTGDRHGFHFNRVARATITGCKTTFNSTTAADGAGIFLDGCEDCVVSGNNAVERVAGAVQKYGIRLANACNRNLIASNAGLNNITKEFEDTSSGVNFWRNNRGDDALPSVGSAATVTIPNLTDSMVNITGGTQIDNFAGHTHIGKLFTVVTVSAVTIRDFVQSGGNINLAGSINLTTTAGSRVSFAYDGTKYVEVCRSIE